MADSPPSADTLRKSAAIECTLFSAMAVGALLLGVPESTVSRHMTAARRTLTKSAGLREQPALSALLLYGLANALLPPRTGAVHGQQQQQETRQQEEDEQQLMDEAQAVYEQLPDKDPLVNAFLVFRATNQNLARQTLLITADSVNPVNNVETSRGQGGGGGASTRRSEAGHPAYVVTDCEFPGLMEGKSERRKRSRQERC